MATMDMLIETDDLTKQFGTLTAVDSVSLRVCAGEVLALLGPNGAGKTTTIRMLASILRPTRGRVKILGYDAALNPVEIRRAVGLLTEQHGLYTRMRATEYLEFFGLTYGVSKKEIKERCEELLTRYGLDTANHLRLGQYSKGMRQKLALVRAMIHNPAVLLLDEPTSAMDPASAHLVRESIAGLRSEARAIVVCTHNLHEAGQLADRIAIIHRGRIVANGTPQELKHASIGDPIMEIRLVGSLDGVMNVLPPGLKIVASGPGWLRYQVAKPEEVNPIVLQALAEARIPVMTLSEVERSLEDVYLRVVAHEETNMGEAA
jgi:ABC-2 type transport system ATP-binding protein